MQENTPDDMENDAEMKKELESGYKGIGIPEDGPDRFATDALGRVPEEEDDRGEAN
jgi:hypothetical protein